MAPFPRKATHLKDKPIFHVAPNAGWVNDPNGPLFFGGKYHMFYQHVNTGCEWSFGLVWGHAISDDLITWEHLPDALVPTKGGNDADGCFSGCATVDVDGTPTILFTGVRLRSNVDCGPMPPTEYDLHLPFIESQLFATADPSDPTLTRWNKREEAFIQLPPLPDMHLTGWRDPYIIERPSPENNHEWVMVIGSGIKGMGGSVLVYRSQSLTSGWRYDGELCNGDGDTGAVWECPIIVHLRPLARKPHDFPSHTLGLGGNFLMSPGGGGSSSSTAGPSGRGAEDGFDSSPFEVNGLHGATDERYSHFFCISPDACTNPCLYWLGRYAAGRFDLDRAKGPFRLDLGDIAYAPNILPDEKHGRTLMWAWMQERRTVGTYEYAGCLCLPRIISLDYDRLYQEPLPELAHLRTGEAWHDTEIVLQPEQPVPLPSVGGPFLDIEVTLKQGSAATVGMLLKSWNASGEGGAAVLYNWETGTLEVVFEALDPATMNFSLTAPTARTIGGNIDMKPGQPLKLRVLIDYSIVEIFTSTGEVLSTRMYRGNPPPGADAGIEFIAFGGTATIARVEAYEMSSIWRQDAVAMAREAEAQIVSDKLGEKPSRRTSLDSIMGRPQHDDDLFGAESFAAVTAEQEPNDLFLEVMA